MKRSYSNRELDYALLPKFSRNDPELFKTTLSGSYELKVLDLWDISKPPEKPIDDIEEPEDEEAATENRLNKNSARMLMLHLCDKKGTEIKALEVERLEVLTNVKKDWVVYITGPVILRCGNLMLERKNVVRAQPSSDNENPNTGTCPTGRPSSERESGPASKPQKSFEPQCEVIDVVEDWDEADEEECIIID